MRFLKRQVGYRNRVEFLEKDLGRFLPGDANPALIRPLAFLGRADAFDQIGLTFKQAHDLPKGDFFRFPGKELPAFGTPHPLHQPGFLERADELFDVFCGNLLKPRDLTDLKRPFITVAGKLQQNPCAITAFRRKFHSAHPFGNALHHH
jgi:hypothetical protein